MTYEEALVYIENTQRTMTKNRGRFASEYIEANGMAILALEKQIPKKPLKMKYKPLLEGGWEFACPSCGCGIGKNKFADYEYLEEYEPFCAQCGQSLDWRDEQ